MPIYEFYCADCNTIFNFLSKRVDTKTRPQCPRCRKRKLERGVSVFALTGRKGEEKAADDLPIDESKMESAMTELAAQAEGINEDDPRQAAQLMRKFSKMTGLNFGGGMEEALGRLEAGEDPEKVEAEMGDLLEGEEPFATPDAKGRRSAQRRAEPFRDKTLYEM
jgi:putative FmdB family regulatory protein